MALPSPLTDLFSRRLLIVSGKGGVGKTTVSIALARLGVRSGKRVLLAGIETQGELGRLLGRPELGAEPVKVAAGVQACDLDAKTALRDFLRLRLKIHAIADRVASNRAFAGFFTAAPGLREYVLLGKAWYEARDRSGWLSGGPRHDLVVLDAPASGHATAFLRAAHQITDVMVGPLRTQATEIRAFVTDPALTALVLVATPEELAVNEAVEFARAARRPLGVHVGLVVLNGVFPRLFERATGGLPDSASGPDLALLRAAQFRISRETEQARLLRRVRRSLPGPQIVLERLLEPEDDDEVLAAVERELAEAHRP